MQELELNNIEKAVNWVYLQFENAALFYGHGSLSAWDEAVYLVMFVMELPPDSGREVLSMEVSKEQSLKIREFAEKRIKQRMPLSYLTHEAWFAGLPFYIDERALIPRSPFAELIEYQFSPWVEYDNVQRILDLCTGSGCMGIAAALAFPKAQVDAVDINADALEVAKINVEKYQLENRVHLIKSNLFEKVTAKYDIIMSNPPYVDKEEMQNLPQEYSYEPKLALEAGMEGLDFAIKILKQARHFLEPEGILVVEVGDAEEALVARYPKVPFIWLDLERGGDGLFLLTKEDLDKYF